jgi:hypothetical protein
VAEFEEMARCDLAARDVVDGDARKGRMQRVDQDAGDARCAEAIDLGLGRKRRDDEETVRPVSPVEQLERAALPGLRLDVEDHQVVRRAAQAVDDASDPLHRGRVGEPRQKRGDHHRPLEREPAGQRARAIVQRLDRFADPFPGTDLDASAAVQHPRDRRDSHAGKGGHVGDTCVGLRRPRRRAW